MNPNFPDIAALANRYGTPLVVYSEEELLANLRRLRSALPPTASLAYSMKANPNPMILRLLLEHGLMADTASHGELALALRHGAPPGAVMLGGPTKSPDAIALALDRGLFALLVESEQDLLKIQTLAERVGRRMSVLLRVNFERLGSHSGLRMAGLRAPFGIAEGQLTQILRLCDHPLVTYEGLFMYAGSQHFLATDIVANTRQLARLAQRLCRDGFPPPRVLDFGGGFGVPEASSQPQLDLDQLKIGLKTVFDEELANLRGRGLHKAIFESGRYLVASAAVYAARVVDLKELHGRRFAVLDGGINHLGIWQMPYRAFDPGLEVWGRANDGAAELITLVGPTCTPIDVIHRGDWLPPLRLDDLIVIPNFGAYTISFSPVHFCGHAWPAEVLVRVDGTNQLVRRRGNVEEACGPGYPEGPAHTRS
jgi:diaminopimelate decarboxylase